ncbi:MAG: hypothetical protein KDA85_15180 [Planctomycetaceae bacterium]|nr:hypothetical protein [Planctomycetaceae bacterium]
MGEFHRMAGGFGGGVPQCRFAMGRVAKEQFSGTIAASIQAYPVEQLGHFSGSVGMAIAARHSVPGFGLGPHILEALLRMRVAVAGRREFAEAELPG